MSPQVWWYLTRASGIVAWLMLTASVLWGVMLSAKDLPGRRRPAWLLDLHRWLGALTLGFIGLHVTALVADSYVHFGAADVLVPFASSWRPAAVALGIVSGWLLVTVQVTSLAMRRLPRKVWHAIHLSSYATFWLATVHAALAGSDRANLLYQVTGALAILAVAGASIYRATHRGQPRREGVVRPPRPRSSQGPWPDVTSASIPRAGSATRPSAPATSSPSASGPPTGSATGWARGASSSPPWSSSPGG